MRRANGTTTTRIHTFAFTDRGRPLGSGAVRGRLQPMGSPFYNEGTSVAAGSRHRVKWSRSSPDLTDANNCSTFYRRNVRVRADKTVIRFAFDARLDHRFDADGVLLIVLDDSGWFCVGADECSVSRA
ncbi:MAG: hypothetical protein WKF82_12435 [Nocardioidaceae bacterium]